MGRIIRLRAWDKYTHCIFNTAYMDLVEGELELQLLGNDEAVLMQFTGLLDKNGEEIYEGDIIEASWGWGHPRCEVRLGDSFYNTYESTVSDDIKVIGNIYENPKLLNY